MISLKRSQALSDAILCESGSASDIELVHDLLLESLRQGCIHLRARVIDGSHDHLQLHARHMPSEMHCTEDLTLGQLRKLPTLADSL